MTSLPPTEQEGGGRSETTDEAQTETKDALMKLLSFVFSASVSDRRRCHATEQRADGAPGDNQPSVTLGSAHCTEHEGEEWVDTRLSAAHTHTHTFSFFPVSLSFTSFLSLSSADLHSLPALLHSFISACFLSKKNFTHMCSHTHTDPDTTHAHTDPNTHRHTYAQRFPL